MLRYTRIHTKTDDKGFYLHWSCTAGEQYTDFMEIDHVEDKPGVSEIIEELLECYHNLDTDFVDQVDEMETILNKLNLSVPKFKGRRADDFMLRISYTDGMGFRYEVN